MNWIDVKAGFSEGLSALTGQLSGGGPLCVVSPKCQASCSLSLLAPSVRRRST